MSNYDLLIRSASRTSNSTSSSDFTINLAQSIDCSQKRFVKLKYFQSYNTIYNIDATNNCLDFNENSTNKAITPITPGLYTATDLIIALIAALNTASSGFNTYTGSYSAITKLFTISAGNAFTLQFKTGTHASTSLWKALGWTSSNGLTAVDSATALSVTSPYIANLSTPNSMFLQLDNLSSNMKSSDDKNITFYIPITVPGGSLIEYREKKFEQKAFVSETSLKTFGVKLLGANGQTLSLNGSEFEFILSLSE